MKLFVLKDGEEKYKFGFEGFGKTLDCSNPYTREEISCTSDHGHCWVPGPTLLCNPPIHIYTCEHCHATKQKQEKEISWCRKK